MILTDEQELAVIHATRPLQANERMTFMNALEALLAGRDHCMMLPGPLLALDLRN
jgi:hypothetical protein